MAGRRLRASAFGLVVLLVASTWLGALTAFDGDSIALGEQSEPSLVGVGDTVDLTLTTLPNSNFDLDLPADEPLVSAELNFTPKVLPSQSGFVWDSASDWNHPDALSNGSSVSSTTGGLTGSSPGILWDFNTNSQGWTFSNSYTGRVTTPACGYNGTSGGSLRTYAGSTYGTSPVLNLAGGVNIPFHAWVHEGRVGCGETPDSGENLQFQYRTSSGSWTTFRTFSGGGSQTTNFQFMTTLPAAALHASSQFRIHQTSGSSTCCDYWFIDDIHIATPPASNWTSPSMGHRSGVTQGMASGGYAPLYIDATVPQGSYLNWSILNPAGEVIPGMTGSNQNTVPLGALNPELIDEFRLHLEFLGSENGIPEVFAISGEGDMKESFWASPAEDGWSLNGAVHLAENSVNTSASGCGVDATSADIQAYPDHPVFNLSQQFTATLVLMCNPLGDTLRTEWSIVNESGLVVTTGSFQITPSNRNQIYLSRAISTNMLNDTVPMNYTLQTVYKNRPASGGSFTPMAWANASFATVNWTGSGTSPLNQPSECESNTSLTTLDGFTNKDSYLRTESLSFDVFATCLGSSSNVRVSWELVKDGTGVRHDHGQITWAQSTPATTVQRTVSQVSLQSADQGSYSLNTILDVFNSSTSFWDRITTHTSSLIVDWRVDYTVAGEVNDALESPWYLASKGLYELQVNAQVTNAQLQARHHPLEPWTNVSLPYSPVITQESVGVQLRVTGDPSMIGVGSAESHWYIEQVEVGMYGGFLPARPSVDFNLDQRYEWGGEDTRVGKWGWQDRFINSEESTEVTVANGAPAVAKAWVPTNDLTSFGFSYVVEAGSLQEISLFVGNTLVANRSTVNTSVGLVHLTPVEFVAFTTELASVANSVTVLGTEFTEVRIELIGQGVTTLAGLRATHNASFQLVADASSSFVMGVNEARTSVPNIGGMQAVPLPMMAESRGGLTVEVVALQTSGTVLLKDGSMLDVEPVLTPSQRWQTISTEYQVTGATVTHHRLDLFSKVHHATWLFPHAGGSPAGLGDASLVELHPTDPIEVVEEGMTVTTNITFRLRPSWDDETQLTATSRLVLQNGVIAIPYSHAWTAMPSMGYAQGYENDLELKGVDFFEDGIMMPPTRQYLRGGETMNVSVEVGFEGLSTPHGFVDGDALLTLYMDGVQLRNTTSVNGKYWNFTQPIPFTYGDVTWTVELESLGGSNIIGSSDISRTFTVDSVKPRVVDASMYRYDHRTPSPTQVIQVTIKDQPVLPSSMSAMVWKEWVDDDNLNGWPDAGEYSSMPMLTPSDLTTLTGVYTLMMDDTAGSLGQKVAIYLEGTDPSGYAIQDGGSSADNDQLFVYQLAVDGAPELAPDAFAWVNGRQAWLHPQQPYELNVKISEPNGGSDLSTVEVMLASNQGSDTMSILWEFDTGNCTTSSVHIILETCTMLGSNGLAGPFEKDMVLNIQLRFGWNTPDLGDNRREPAILVADRAGQEELRAFPEHRWRFSAGLGIPEESVNLYLTRGSFLGDGARVTPLTPMEISGGLVFSETSTVPDFECNVDLLFAGQTYSAVAYDGIWSMALEAPIASGSIPLTWEVGCLEGQGVDLTDKETSVKWIVVDGTGPVPMEVLSPRPMAILGGENHEVRVVMQELGGLDLQSLELVWVVEDYETGDLIRNGREPLSLEGEALEGLQLELFADMNLSSITNEMLIDRMVVKISIDGRDLAGNDVTGLEGQSANLVVATWNMEWLQPKFELKPSAMTYSRLLMDVGDKTSIQLEVENTGTLAGTTEVIFESVRLDGTRVLVHRTSVEAEAGSIGLVSVDWGPEEAGLQWVEATLTNGQTSSGPTVDVRVAQDPSFTQKVFGDVNPVLGAFTALLLTMVVLTLLIWMKRMTVNQGSKVAYDWDEYSSDLDEDDEDDYGYETAAAPSVAAASSALASATASATDENDTDWVMGADGYWWYHDKATNEWWYKDANGEIVKHP